MSLFKGFNQIDLLKEEPRVLCAILAEQLALTNKALATQAEELRQLRDKVESVSTQQMAGTM